MVTFVVLFLLTLMLEGSLIAHEILILEDKIIFEKSEKDKLYN